MTITYARYVGRWSSCSRLASRLQPWVGGRECLSVVIGRDVTLPSSQVANGIHPFHPSIHPFQKVHSVFHHPPRLFLCICLPIRGARQPFFFFRLANQVRKRPTSFFRALVGSGQDVRHELSGPSWAECSPVFCLWTGGSFLYLSSQPRKSESRAWDYGNMPRERRDWTVWWMQRRS